MLQKKSQFSPTLFDYLIQIMPGLQVQIKSKEENAIDPVAAKNLFAIWKDEKNKISDRVYQRPYTVSASQVESMSDSGLIKTNGDNIEITDKGAKVIRVMVLGDDSSIFDKKDDKLIGYSEALSNTKKASTLRGHNLTKTASDNWWKRFEDADNKS